MAIYKNPYQPLDPLAFLEDLPGWFSESKEVTPYSVISTQQNAAKLAEEKAKIAKKAAQLSKKQTELESAIKEVLQEGAEDEVMEKPKRKPEASEPREGLSLKKTMDIAKNVAKDEPEAIRKIQRLLSEPESVAPNAESERVQKPKQQHPNKGQGRVEPTPTPWMTPVPEQHKEVDLSSMISNILRSEAKSPAPTSVATPTPAPGRIVQAPDGRRILIR